MNIEFDTTELIKELKSDVSEFGPRCLVDVKFSEDFAVDYNLHFEMNDPDLDENDIEVLNKTAMPLSKGDRLEVMEIVDALLIFTKQLDPSGSLNYIRDLIKEYGQFIKITPLLSVYGIDKGNYSRFMAGDDTKLSEEKAELLFNALLKRPIG